MNGDARGDLNPIAAATRAETAALIYNLRIWRSCSLNE
ncbi:hypothetical protein JOC55_004528 [Paenibacillus sacheonensis]|nr:hypothetical protein [Paenibacillus sacheonensis]